MTDPVEALRTGSKETWTSPLTGVAYTYRRLVKADLLECPEAWPIFELAIGFALDEVVEDEPEDEFQAELLRRRKERHDDDKAKLIEHQDTIAFHLITSGLVSPRVLPNPDDMTTDPPEGALFYYQVPEVDRTQLVLKIQKLMSGLDVLERTVAAKRAASFREDDSGRGDVSTEPAPDPAVPASGHRG